MKRAKTKADPIHAALVKLTDAALALAHEAVALLQEYERCQASKAAQPATKAAPRLRRDAYTSAWLAA